MKLAYFLLLFVVAFPVTAQSDNDRLFRGKIVDETELPVVGAEITVTSDGENFTCRSDNQGDFVCKRGTNQSIEITVRANGFSILRQIVAIIQDVEVNPTFILRPEVLRNEVFVDILKAKTSVKEAPASVQSLNRSDIERSAASSVDGVLRQTVGFSLFRRTESTTSNPTTQGASLRGVNSSGASRSTVLLDGIPINDPFGGWIVWGRVPKGSLERIEILRGGGSSFYGSGSIGGTIDIVPRTASEKTFEFSGELGLGSSKTSDGSTFFGLRKNKWSADLFLSTFQTGGYKVIEEAARGAVDDFANSRNTNGSLNIIRRFAGSSRLFGRASHFGEARNNGTPVQKNRTHIRDFSIGGDFDLDRTDEGSGKNRIVFAVFGSTQVFDQTFSAVSGDRNSENLVRFQRVPAQRTGFSFNFVTYILGNNINAGFEAVEVRGASNETGFFNGNATSQIGSGGRERYGSFYLNDFVRATERLSFSGSLRYERRRNFRALSTLRSISMNTAETTIFDDRTNEAWSPGGAVLFGLNDNLAVYGSLGKSFRAPTLNELYRGFRVGNIITNPNEQLLAERASNAETGLKYSNRGFYASVNFFRTAVSNSISNVTIDPGPGLIIRQRQNAGETVSQGIEIEVNYRKDKFGFSSGFLFADARVSEFDSNPLLIGNRIPQVPKTQFTFQADFTPSSRWTIAFQGRASSSQFDDDTNEFELESYFRGDLFVSGRLTDRIKLFTAIENVFNTRYTVGRTPVRTIGAPFAIRAGLRFD